MHEASAAAAEQWLPRDGVPANLSVAGLHRALPQRRRHCRRARLDGKQTGGRRPRRLRPVDKSRRRRAWLIFHLLPPRVSARGVAPTLREVAGLTTEEVARAWFRPRGHRVAQRIVRANHGDQRRGHPHEVPGRAELPGVGASSRW